MSASTAKSAHAAELRRITTEERLRATNLETLEILQRTKNENEELRKKLQAYENDEIVNRQKESRVNEEASLAENAFIMQKIQNQLDQINDLETKLSSSSAEMKTIKTTSQTRIKELERKISVFKYLLN